MTTSDGESTEEPSVIHDGVNPTSINRLVLGDTVIGSSRTEVRQRHLFWRSNPRKRLKRRRDESLGEAPDDATGVLLSLIADCDLRAFDTLRSSKRWSSAYYLLGLPAAVLATISGASGLASTAGRIPAAIIALIAAGLATAATFLNSNENKQRNNKLSAAWQELADDVRLVVIQHAQDTGKEGDFYGYNPLIRDVIRFNKRKSALLRGDIASAPEVTEAPSMPAG